LLAKLKAEKTPEVARLLAGLLSVGNVSSQLADQADEVLSQTGAANENDADLLLSIADMWLAQKKSQKSIDAYRKIVKLRPNDIVALNNLAILLGEQSDGTQEALSLIDQAIRIAGKQPLLLDSKAAILMLANRAEEAVPILEVAASATNDPRVIFHLYQALVKSGREEESLRIKSKINPTELRKSILTPDDQAALEIFEKEIQQ
jgi:Flp pilus assembly protein TadD